MSLVASSCGYYRVEIEPRAAHKFAVHVGHREGARNVDNTAIRHAFNPWRLGGSDTANVHGPLRSGSQQAPSRDQGHPGGAHGRSNDPIASPSPRDALPARLILFSPPGNGFSILDARWKPLIWQYNSEIIRGDTVGLSFRIPPWCLHGAVEMVTPRIVDTGCVIDSDAESVAFRPATAC